MKQLIGWVVMLALMLSVIPGVAVAAEEAQTGLWDWYIPAWNTQITMAQEEDCLSFTYDRSTVGWNYVAAAAKGEFSGGDRFRFTMDLGEERGYTAAIMIRFLYTDTTYSDVWVNAQQGKAEYNVIIPVEVSATLQEVQLYPESPYDPFESQTVSIKLYEAAMVPSMENVGLGAWYIPWWDNKLTMAEEAGCLSFTYDRANASWSYFAAPATQSVGAGGTFSFVLDFGPDRGYTSAFMIRFQYADNTNADIWVNAKEGKAQYDVTVPYEATSTVSEVQIYPESPYDSFESKTVTVRLYEASLTVVPMVYEGLNPFYYPSWWGDNGSWATENPITVDWSNPTAMEVSYGSRSGSAAGWKCIIAEPTVAVSGGATLTMDLEFFPERTGNFLVSFYADGTSVHDAYVDVTGKRATYTVQVPETVQNAITEVRIQPENPWATELPDEASTLRFYSVVLTPKADPNEVEAYNLVLGDNIGVNFYLHLNSQFLQSANAALQVTVAGKTTLLPIGQPNENGQYVFSVGVAAAQMTTPIVLQLKADDYSGEEWTYTVADYAKYILNGEYSDETKALVRTMLDYGGKAQTYFKYRTETMANANLTDVPVYTVPAADDYATMVSGHLTGIKVFAATLVLRTRLAIRYYFTIADGYDYQFAVNSVPCSVVEAGNGMYYVEVADILPQNIDQVYTVTVTDDNGQTLSVSYSAMHYITRKYASSSASAALKALVNSLYAYGMAAKDY